MLSTSRDRISGTFVSASVFCLRGGRLQTNSRMLFLHTVPAGMASSGSGVRHKCKKMNRIRRENKSQSDVTGFGAFRSELLQGTLDLLIFRTLLPGRAHGHPIVEPIECNYGALHRLIRRG